MNLGDLKTLARTYVRAAKKTTIGDAELELILNLGALEVAQKSICLKTNEKFNSVAGIGTYNLTSTLTRYLVMDKPGVWYRSSSSEDYIQLNPTTIKALDNDRPGWRDLDSDDPTDYAIEGDDLIVVPAPSDAITDAFWVYFGQAPQSMTNNTHFPFGHSTEIYRLKTLQEAILAFWEWKAVKALESGIDAYRAAETAFDREFAKQLKSINRRPDIQSEAKVKAKKMGQNGF